MTDTSNSYRHRRQTARVRVLADGKPLAGAAVHLAQQRHKFLFGCGAFEAVNLTPARSEAERSLYKTTTTEAECQFYRRRMELWLELFNFGTLPFYWGKFERREGETISDQIREAAVWLKNRGVTLKGHPLCWHTNCAEWLLQYPLEEMLRRQKDRIRREVEGFRGLIDMWDVINEVVIMPEFTRCDNAVTRIAAALGRVETVRQMFETARETNPGATLLINDFNVSSRYEDLIAACLDAGISIDAIGIQSHQHQGFWGEEKLYDVLERFSRFGLPLHFTENTFTSGHLMPQWIEDLNDYSVPSWPSTPEGLARQSDDIERFYRILFADPHVEAITTWAFQDGAWLGAPAGLVTVDNQTKPAFHRLKHLLKEEWWTDCTCRTDDAGWLELEGYRGDYTAEAAGWEGSFTLDRDRELTVRLDRREAR